MTDHRHPATPDGYFGWPEGDDAVQFLDPETGKQLTRKEWDARMARKAEARRAAGGSSRSPTIVTPPEDEMD
jgi:hypothetical protein